MMMRSLWSGVSGLQTHQIAMDVEGNNIANVNTKGYKYDRVSFSDHISQTSRTAAPPNGNRGGTNAKQVGLGTTAQGITKVFKQGSAETTDVATDLAIENDGFFIISSDGGNSFKYTRNGEFSFDEAGNFVSVDGHIVQGWMINKETGLVDRTVPIGNIVIPSGLTSEARASSNITIKANLDSGDSVGKNIAYASALDTYHGFVDKDESGTNTDPSPLPAGTPPIETHDENTNTDFIYDKNQNITEYGLNAQVLYDKSGEAINLRKDQGIWFSYATATSKQTITADGNLNGNIKLNGSSINIQTNIPANITDTAAKKAYNANKIAEIINDLTSKTGVTATANGTDVILKNENRIGTTKETKNIDLKFATGSSGFAGFAEADVITAYNYKYSSSSNIATAADLGLKDSRTFTTTEDLREHIRKDIMDEHTTRNTITIPNPTPTPGTPTITVPIVNVGNAKMNVTMNEFGQFQITHKSDDTAKPKFNFAITSYSDDDTPVNKKFTNMMQGLDGEISQVIDKRISSSFCSSTYATTANIYDSLGTKHTVRLEYTKTGVTTQNGTEWRVNIVCAEPGKLAHEQVRINNNDSNVVTGIAKFNEFGALTSFYPSNLFFTPNNGAEPNQNIKLDIGSIGKFDGLTSYDAESSTSNYSTDGYPAGDLVDKKINSQGTVVGTFSNGQTKDLAQVAMAKFVNNQGLEKDGGNNFIQTSNSGDPIIGTANTGGRGNIKSSSLEMSNVDLSRSLTQLIVVQRGFQANSKTITTSDQMLNTLLQLKQ